MNLELSSTEMIMDPKQVLFQVNMEIANYRSEMEAKCRGKDVRVGNDTLSFLRFDEKTLIFKKESKEVPIPFTKGLIRQLLDGTTTRK